MRIASPAFSLNSGLWQTIVSLPIKFHQVANFPVHLNHLCITSRTCYLMSRSKLSTLCAFLPWVRVHLSMWKRLLWENSSVLQPNPITLGGSPHQHPGSLSLPVNVSVFCRVLKTCKNLSALLALSDHLLPLPLLLLLVMWISVLKTWYLCHFWGLCPLQNLLSIQLSEFFSSFPHSRLS